MATKRCIVAVSVFLLLAAGVTPIAAANPDIGWWKFDGDATDSSANALHGNEIGSPAYAEGMFGQALSLDGSNYVEVPHNPVLDLTNQITVAAWVKLNHVNDRQPIVVKERNEVRGIMYRVDEGTRLVHVQLYKQGWTAAAHKTDVLSTTAMEAHRWYHLAFTYEFVTDGTSKTRLYIDGELHVTHDTTVGPLATNTQSLEIGRYYWSSAYHRWFSGLIDDVQIYSRVLTESEIGKIMEGRSGLSSTPQPANEATDVPRDIALGWTAGEFAATRDVYFGTAFADIDDASRTSPAGVLVSQGQTATTYQPAAPLEYSQTYYWRVDEVNAPPDSTIFRGDVWSFTVEPYAYPITNITATASSAKDGNGPENTVNGSGLNPQDQHSTDEAHMWISTGDQPSWIQYEFDQVHKLHELWVWNYNHGFEPFVGWGAKEVKIEYSVDGETWAELQDVPEFAQATGESSYTYNTTVPFGGVFARFVRLTITDNWGTMVQTGLSEVRFLQVPVQAREPVPADGATGVALDADLIWRSGREAQSHQVYFGKEADAVAAGTALSTTQTARTYTPAALDLSTTYFWKVDEVGETGTFEGDLWSFTTQEFLVVEDFEEYDDQDNRIYQVWIDGEKNNTGSTVGYNESMQGTFGERTIVYSGKQSMPLFYDNSASPFYSETERTFAGPQDLAASGAQILQVNVRGRMGPGVVRYDATAQTYDLTGAGYMWGTVDAFHFAHKQLTGNGSITVRVDRIMDNPPGGDPRIGIMIRDSLEPDSANALLFVEPDPRTRLTMRTMAGGETANAAVANIGATPTWLRLTREGFLFKAERSDNGTSWTPLLDTGSQANIAMTDPVYIGLAVSSHVPGQFVHATVSNVSTTGQVTPAGPFSTSQDIGIISNSPEPLYVRLQDSAERAATVASDGLVVTTAWTAWDIPFSSFTGVNAAAVTKIAIGVGDRQNPKPGGTGEVFIDEIRVSGPRAVDPGQRGLVAYYPFENNTNDASGNGLHGTVSGAPTYTDGRPGSGRAMSFEFDNAQDCVVAPPLDVIGSGITLAAWIQPESFAQADGRIIDKGTDVAAANDAWWMLSTVASGGQTRLRFRLKTNESENTATQIATSGDIALGEWCHATAVWNGTSMILYKDGVEVGRVAKGGTAVATNPEARVYIGNQLGGVQRRPWDGLIDEVRIYGRALSEFEVRYLAGAR
jgi:hypothetical protein